MEFIETPESSNVAGFKHDPTKNTLTVKFKDNSVYDYFNVPGNIFEGMKSASSKGSYLSAHVKRKFSFKRR